MKKLSQTSRDSTSQNLGMWGAEGGGHLQYTIREGSMQLRVHDNCVFFPPVNILDGNHKVKQSRFLVSHQLLPQF